jgi:alcohol-forming fatty acyl-CoA reductase
VIITSQADDRIIFDNDKKREIMATVDILINNAASIDFNLRLDEAIQINIFGALHLLAMAKQCQRL